MTDANVETPAETRTISSALTKAKVVVLIGAGASMPLGLLATKPFLDRFVERYDQWALDSGNELITAFLGELRYSGGTPSRDIEDILDLLDRRAQAADLLAGQGDFARRIQAHLRDGNAQLLVANYGMSMRQIAEQIRDEVIDHYSTVDPEQAARLYRPLLVEFPLWFSDVPDLGNTLPFFTLNYDTAVEHAASILSDPSICKGEERPVELVDGLGSSRGAAERRWSARAFEGYQPVADKMNVVLLKLHGSVRWGRRGTDPDVIVELPPDVGRDPGRYRHAVLYPTLAPKPVAEEPFRTGYRCLRACLREAFVLLIIGTSLRDPEVVAAICDGMDDNPNLHLIVLGPSADHEEVARRVNGDRSRMAALQDKFDFPPDTPLGENPLMGDLRALVRRAVDVGPPSWARFNATFGMAEQGPKGVRVRPRVK